jgi:hypothetical protein
LSALIPVIHEPGRVAARDRTSQRYGAGDLADSTVAYSSPCGGQPLAGKLVSSGGVEDRGDQEIEVAVIDPGDGVAELDGDVSGEAGGESEHSLFAVLTELKPGT